MVAMDERLLKNNKKPLYRGAFDERLWQGQIPLQALRCFLIFTEINSAFH